MSSFPAPIRQTLRQVLRRAHLRVALVAVCTVGLSLTLLGLVALRAYADHNLRLIARSMAYTVEAAVVFHDRGATLESLELIAAPEQVAHVTVTDSDGEILAGWERPPIGRLHGVETELAQWLMPPSVVLPIVHEGQKVGSLEVVGHGGSLLDFLLSGLAGVLACSGLSALVAIHLSRRLLNSITAPIRNLTNVAHAVRCDRAFGMRVTPAEIAELNQFGNDFNALLDEFEGWQNTLQTENSSLIHLANHDSLTGLANRAAFEGQLDREMGLASANGTHLAVLFIDCNRFKEINDHYGHAAGDAVLVCVAARLRAEVRSDDLVARLGGDEFGILISPLAAPADAVRIADHILLAMNTPIPLPQGENIVATVSIGIAMFPQHAEQPDALLAQADAAMYRAKTEARGARAMAGVAPEAIEIPTGD
jgi:diguanylate cyclase (GGDEF)-like protein